jgi:hypothetical protein
MAEPDIEARLDELFGSDPKVFVSTRNALARALEADGNADEAAAIKALRKPTGAVAAVNRVARAHADRVAALVEIGAELAALQAARAPDRDALRDLTRQRRTLLRQLTELAARTTERPDAARSSIAATLDAASLDAQLRDDLLRGRITHELAPAARFVADDPTSARPTPRRPVRTTRGAPPRDELAARRARAELEAAEERAREADESLREHAAAAEEATERLDAAHRHVADLEAALADARRELAELARAERDAQRAERRARTQAERVAAARPAAERAADETK